MGKTLAKSDDENEHVTKCYTGPCTLKDPFKQPKQWDIDMRFRIEI